MLSGMSWLSWLWVVLGCAMMVVILRLVVTKVLRDGMVMVGALVKMSSIWFISVRSWLILTRGCL